MLFTSLRKIFTKNRKKELVVWVRGPTIVDRVWFLKGPFRIPQSTKCWTFSLKKYFAASVIQFHICESLWLMLLSKVENSDNFELKTVHVREQTMLLIANVKPTDFRNCNTCEEHQWRRKVRLNFKKSWTKAKFLSSSSYSKQKCQEFIISQSWTGTNDQRLM
jgi:hypothetical protein